MEAIYKRELKSLFNGLTAWIYMGVMFVMCGIFTMANNLLSLYSQFEYVLSSLPLFLLVAVPILTMRSLSGEKRARTDQLLYSLPLKMSQIVIGKYFALVTVHAAVSLVMGFVPVILSLYGDVHFGSAYSALLGFFLLGCALIAVNLFLSSLITNQAAVCFAGIVAGFLLYLMSGLASLFPSTAGASLFAFVVLSVLAGLVLYFLTKNLLIGGGAALAGAAVSVVVFFVKKTAFEGLFPRIIEYLALFDRLNSFINGIFDITAVVYYITLIIFFVWLSVQSMDKKRWN
ncbi:MAG: ABC-2 transporter permease [Clostridia bacterium]|nr:ABC-2 transporter permease [Clostridia bacterium]